jgi:prephenate dehydrogenase
MKTVANPQQSIVIIGGSGAMGQLFRNYWHAFDVRVLDKSDWDNASNILKNVDLVVISVPINITEQVIIKCADLINSDTILVDFTSIKKRPLELMLNRHRGPVIGLHPMFGPTIESPNNQIIINCGGRYLDKAKWFLNNLTELGFRLINTESDTHDKMMGFIQGIEHFSTFALGNFLLKHNMHPKKIFDISSPIYQTKLALMGRIFDQDPKLYADIIMSDKNRIELITEYIDYLESLKTMLEDQDKEKFIQDFIQIKHWMGQFTQKSQDATDKFLSGIPTLYQDEKNLIN